LEVISLGFIIILLRRRQQNESIMVVMDTLTKETHFILVESTFRTTQIVTIFTKEIFWLHGVPKMAVSDKDAKFTSMLWNFLFGDMGTQLNFSIAYHPQTD